MITVVRLAFDSYVAYCIETGFLAHGNWLRIARALRSIGLKVQEVSCILTELQYSDYSDELLVNSLSVIQGIASQLTQ